MQLVQGGRRWRGCAGRTSGTGSSSQTASRGARVAGLDEDESADVNLDDNGSDEVGFETGSSGTGICGTA